MADRIGVGSLTEQLAVHLVSLRYEALSPAAVARTKQVMLDTMAVAWAGTAARGATAALGLARRQGGTPESTVWGHGGELPAVSAAFVNAVLAAALDYDSHYLGVHSDGVVLPAALAVAERGAVAGRQFLTALVAANDIVCRLGKSAQGTHRGWYYTAIFGIVGAAAATAKLLELDVDATRNALGIALAQACGTQQAAVEHTLTMRFQAGFAARSGVVGGLLAAEGVNAPIEALEGKFGLFSLYQAGDARALLRDLGQTYYSTQVAFKKYPCCACSHAAIEAALNLVALHRLTAVNIDHAVVRISADMARLVGERSLEGADPEVAAQFSVRYAVAWALFSGGFGVRHLQPDALLNSTLRKFAERISVVVEPTFTGKFAPAEVEVTQFGGPTVRSRVDVMPGTPEAPMDDAAHKMKLTECFGGGATPLDSERFLVLCDRVSCLESLPSMRELLQRLVPADLR